MTHLEFEHLLRDAVRAEINRFDSTVATYNMPHLSVAVDYDHHRSDGMWHLYSYVNSVSLEVRGAILHDCMTRHLDSIRLQADASKLPSLIAGPSSSIPGSEDL
ncbi:hypothetical protein UFOVP810_24 [uncultured Caudovirales phage]|uniref:Uncharacterized protein n=1 Tax=uncultured Caudovirales phage TaxID=2100421 RepID=A0A6J5P2Q8_9CAUD|nr:hypothetical protein UFOVP810_24 [uncultured Caudovirales phage]